MNYFELYQLPVSFLLPDAPIRSNYLALSRQYHPDFYAQQDAEKREFALSMSDLNNKAYNTLRDFDKRMHYILELKGLISDNFKAEQLPNDFLMEMMELNEALMELDFDFNATTLQNIEKTIQDKENQLLMSINPILEQYDDSQPNEEILKKVKIFYLKKRYFLRIREKLSTFATAK